MKKLFFLVIFVASVCFIDSSQQVLESTVRPRTEEVEQSAEVFPGHENEPIVKPTSFQIIEFNWHHVAPAYTMAVWILIASVAKILFHINKKFGEAIPDSSRLVIVGLILGYFLITFNVEKTMLNLDATSFFLYLLPPIMFDAGYFMPNRQLFENIDSVVMFAILGTCLNTAAISGTLYLCGSYGLFNVEFNIYEICLFGALISAVDPVSNMNSRYVKYR